MHSFRVYKGLIVVLMLLVMHGFYINDLKNTQISFVKGNARIQEETIFIFREEYKK